MPDSFTWDMDRDFGPDPEGERRIIPQPGPQRRFLSSNADIALFGGAAGSGKSWALMLEAMRYPGDKRYPGFDSVMFRRNTTDIRRPGGLWSESMKLFPYAGAYPISHTLSWKWPHGGAVKLSHLEYEHTVLDWHGSQVPCICFDELTTFTRYQFFYLLSRNRGMTGVRPYIRASCNADAGSWVAEFIQWWWDPVTGYPIPERSGTKRYFVRGPDDQLIWFDTKRQAMAATGRSAETIKSATFIAAKLSDNPALMRNDPQYLGNLMMLPAVERERLLNGNWKIRPSAGLYFNRAWVQVVDIAPKVLDVVRGWDLAATPETAENDPDYTTSVKMGRLGDGRYLVMDATSFRGTPADVERRVMNMASHDGYQCKVGIPQDPGQAGKAQVSAMVRMLAGYSVEFSPETGDKITRFSPFSAQCEAGNVLVLRGDWNERWFQMLEGFPELPHDDDCDATARAFNLVADGRLAEWLRL
jgi:predicted phage terminase large subunit-like protein